MSFLPPETINTILGALLGPLLALLPCKKLLAEKAWFRKIAGFIIVALLVVAVTFLVGYMREQPGQAKEELKTKNIDDIDSKQHNNTQQLSTKKHTFNSGTKWHPERRTSLEGIYSLCKGLSELLSYSVSNGLGDSQFKYDEYLEIRCGRYGLDHVSSILNNPRGMSCQIIIVDVTDVAVGVDGSSAIIHAYIDWKDQFGQTSFKQDFTHKVVSRDEKRWKLCLDR